MVVAPAASEEMSLNGTIMAEFDHKSHSSLTFLIYYSKEYVTATIFKSATPI